MSLALIAGKRTFDLLVATIGVDAVGGQTRTWTVSGSFNGFYYAGMPTIVPNLAGRYSQRNPATIISNQNPKAVVGNVVRLADNTVSPTTYTYFNVRAQRPMGSPFNPIATAYVLECESIEPPTGVIK